jgi:hypothetical protein
MGKIQQWVEGQKPIISTMTCRPQGPKLYLLFFNSMRMEKGLFFTHKKKVYSKEDSWKILSIRNTPK